MIRAAAGLLARQHKWTLAALIVGTGVATAAAVPAYAGTYPTAAARLAAAQRARADSALTLLYGRLPEPGTPAQFAVWEFGALTCLILAVLFALLTVQCTRAAEDAGQTELIRACGMRPAVPLHAAVVVLGATALATGVASGLAMATLATAAAACAYGCAIAATLLLITLGVGVLAQLAPDATRARSAAVVFVVAAFLARAVADDGGPRWIGWCSPLFVRETVAPAAGDRWWPFAVVAVAAVALAACAGALAVRRDLGSGHWPRAPRLARSLPVRSMSGLAFRLSGSSLARWAVVVTVCGAALVGMGQTTVRSAEAGQLHGGILGTQVTGSDPAAAFLRYVGTVLAVATAVQAVAAVTRVRTDERAGYLEQLRATGIRPWQPLAAGLRVAYAGTLATLAAAAAACWVVGRTTLGITVGDATHLVLGQWAAMVASAGFAALIVGAAPRYTAVAWAPPAAGAVIALLGPLLRLPQTLIDHGLFAQPWHYWTVVLAVLGVTAGVVGCALDTRRDLSP